jgi:hypothetical protein
MTDYDRRELQCYCCGGTSEQTVLLSTNSSGYRDLDQRPSGMARATNAARLQECPFCGYVAFDIDKGDPTARSFLDTAEFRAVAEDPAPEPAERRCLVRAAYEAYRGDAAAAFHATLRAAWCADDRNHPARAADYRLKAAAHLAGSRTKSIDLRLLLLDVLRRASSWDAAQALCREMAAEDLEYPFAEIVAFHAEKIAAADNGRYTIDQPLAGKREPISLEDQRAIEAFARHVKFVDK